MGVTKTDFVRGLQCEKMLWLDAHRPEEKMISQEVRERLDKGNEFGDGAMGLFGPYTETTAYREDGRPDYAAMIAATKECLQKGESVICEAAFSLYGCYCAADILKKDGAGYALYEVKNAVSPRREFLVDLGFQSWLIGKCGVPLTGRFLILNDGEGGYRVQDETKAVLLFERLASRKVWELGKVKARPDPPSVSVGEQCEKPYRCWYYDYCRREK